MEKFEFDMTLIKYCNKGCSTNIDHFPTFAATMVINQREILGILVFMCLSFNLGFFN